MKRKKHKIKPIHDNKILIIGSDINQITSKIIVMLLRKPSSALRYDILDIHTPLDKIIYLREQQFKIKIGKIWQMVLGNYGSFIDLGNNHSSGLDIISYERKIIIELKNKMGGEGVLDLSGKDSLDNKEVVDALKSFGFSTSEAKEALRNINKTDISTEEKISLDLKDLGR